ncbi:macrophage mannose receptor 1-like [Genypterus blacodes]|uniref:macrophage mannose receptor 1-like n=1 Tax=Genypterus blacodes TaxID=154954 RepID=UPI003F75B083
MQWSLFVLILIGQWSSFTCKMYEYHFVSEKKTWEDAQSHCRKKFTDLAILNNKKDVETLLDRKPANSSDFWIGLNKLGNNNRTWHWSLPSVETSLSDDECWREGEPNDYNGKENCVMTQKDQKWADHSCGEKGFSLCYNDTSSGGKFHLIKREKTWLEALKHCREKYTDLVSGTTQLQNASKMLSDELKKLWDKKNIAIGRFRDSWKWSCGRTSSFRNWNDCNSNDDGTDKRKCAVIKDNGTFESKKCTSTFPFVCYKDNLILIKEEKTWEEAIDYCREKHEDLVSIGDLFAQRWVQEKAKNATTDCVWLGMRYSCVVEFWFWVSNEAMSYTNWVPGRETGDCDMSGAMEINGTNYRWVSLSDETKLNFICLNKTGDDHQQSWT